MSVLKKMSAFFRRLSIRDPEGWVPSGSESSTGENITPSSVLSLSAVWACVNLLAGTVGSLPLVVYKTNKDGYREEYKDHPLYRILHDSPNYDQTALDFWEYFQACLELWGNAYARKIKTKGRLTGLVPINPEIVSVKRLDTGAIQYSWPEDGETQKLTDEDVLHVRGFGGGPLGGMSTLQFGRESFGIARAQEKSTGKMFKNGLRPSAVLTFPDFLSEENRSIAREKLTSQFMGIENTGRPLILEGMAKLEQVSINPADAQMLQSRSFSIEEVCRFFGVPPFMVGHSEKSTSWGTGLEQQLLAFQKFPLRRRIKRLEQSLSKQLLTAADRANGIVIKYNLEGLLRGDSKSRAAFYQTMSLIGGFTINEIRKKEGLPPIEGGDVVRIQMQNVPITDAGEDEDAKTNE